MAKRDLIIEKLKKGDMRQKGRSEEVATDVLRRPELFNQVIRGMIHQDAGVRMRAADAAEKITRVIPNILYPYKKLLISKIADSDQQEVRWHVAQLVSRLKLTSAERKQVVAVLVSYLQDKSSIVRTFAMQALTDIAISDSSYRSRITNLIKSLTETGTPAMKSRGKKLLALLEKT